MAPIHLLHQKRHVVLPALVCLIALSLTGPASAGDLGRIPAFDEATVLQGPVTVRVIEGGWLIAIDTEGAAGPESYTFFFLSEGDERDSTSIEGFDQHGTVIKKTQMIEVVLPDAGSMLRAGLAPLTPVELERRRLAPTAQLVPWNEDQRAAARKRYGIDRIVEITDGYELSTFEDVARPAAEDLWTLSSASLRDDVVNTLRSPFQDSPDFPGGSGVSCQSGGEGSTSCSVTSCGGQGGGCQISCSAGWFSCCNCGTPPTCYCIRN